MTDAQPLEGAIAALGDGPLTEGGIARHVAPLFSRVRTAFTDRIYLANHSLGRPLDVTADDVREGLDAWYSHMGGAWQAWSREMASYRSRLAGLLGAARADSVIPKTSAGQGLRAVLNTYDGVPRVIATRGEFDSLDVILREYARRGRIELAFVEPHDDGRFASEDIIAAVTHGADLVVVSQVIFNTGQVVPELAGIVAATHRNSARILLDVYHSLGVFPLDVTAIDVDFAVGGSYKYLRGGPGACFLYVAPRHLDGKLRTLDIGWFAKRDPFAYQRPDPPQLAEGGDAFLESTPPVLPLYQARAGQRFTQAIGVPRLRAWSLAKQRQLLDLLAERGVAASGGGEDRGAFVIVVDPRAEAWAAALDEAGVVTDARGRYLRLCPDILNTSEELAAAAAAVARTRPA